MKKFLYLVQNQAVKHKHRRRKQMITTKQFRVYVKTDDPNEITDKTYTFDALNIPEAYFMAKKMLNEWLEYSGKKSHFQTYEITKVANID